MPISLDAADLKILAALQEDAGLSTVDLAERAGVSQSVCWRRIQRLKDEGVILRQVTLLDRARLGLETQIFAEELSKLPGVQEVNSIVVFSEIKASTALPLAGRSGL
jgi:DNA-binding Lrp family transcriptional regulator